MPTIRFQSRQWADPPAASCRCYIHPRTRHRHQIPIAPAAPPVPNFPRLRALALFGRRPPHRVEKGRHAGVQKPAQERKSPLAASWPARAIGAATIPPNAEGSTESSSVVRKTVLVYCVGRPRISSAGVAAPSLSDLPDWDWYYISAHLLAQNAILLAVRPNSASFGDSGAAFARQNELTFVFRRKLFTHVCY